MNLVLDTSIIIDHLRGGNQWELLLSKVKDEADFYIPTIVIYELFSGKSSKRPKVIEEIDTFLKNFKRIELTEKVAKRAGELYREGGGQAGAADYIVAASAFEVGASLITLNRRHFQQIPGLSIYPL